MKIINLVIDNDIQVPLEDLFTGNFEAHRIEGLVDTYAITKRPCDILAVKMPETDGTWHFA